MDSKGAQLLGRNFERRGRISCLEKLAKVPEVGVGGLESRMKGGTGISKLSRSLRCSRSDEVKQAE